MLSTTICRKSGNVEAYNARRMLMISSHKLGQSIRDVSYISCQDPVLDAMSSCQQNELQVQSKEDPAQHNVIVT